MRVADAGRAWSPVTIGCGQFALPPPRELELKRRIRIHVAASSDACLRRFVLIPEEKRRDCTQLPGCVFPKAHKRTHARGARGYLRLDTDERLAHELLIGLIYYRLLVSRAPFDKKLSARGADAVMQLVVGGGSDGGRGSRPARRRHPRIRARRSMTGEFLHPTPTVSSSALPLPRYPRGARGGSRRACARTGRPTNRVKIALSRACIRSPA